MIMTPSTVWADQPSVTVIASKSAVYDEIGGVLPNYYTSIMGSGLYFDLMKPQDADEVSIINAKLNGDVISLTLGTGGSTYTSKVGDVFFTAYDDAGKLTYLSEAKDALVGEYTYKWIGVDINGGTNIKAFVWDLPMYAPLCESKSN